MSNLTTKFLSVWMHEISNDPLEKLSVNCGGVHCSRVRWCIRSMILIASLLCCSNSRYEIGGKATRVELQITQLGHLDEERRFMYKIS